MFSTALVDIIPAHFSERSKVWIFQSSRAFIDKEQREINEQLQQFSSQWQSHGTPVTGWAQVVYGLFIIVIAEEDSMQVSGCSTDGIMRMMKSIERQYEVNLFDRLMLTILVNGKAQMLPMSQLKHAMNAGKISEETLVFQNAVTTKKDLLSKWLVPIKDSFLAAQVHHN